MMEPVNISICNQKGGIGKSTFTVLRASYLHYTLGHDVLVVDCDYPQWSIHAQRERELTVVKHSDYYKLMMVRQFKTTGRKLWPLLKCMPPEAPEEVERIRQNGYLPRIVLYDLPGTVNAGGGDPDTFLLRCRLHSPEGRQTRHGEFPYVRTRNRAWIRSGQGHLIAGRPSFLDDDRPSGAYSSLRSV